MGLLDRLNDGDISALARLATYVEDDHPLGIEAIERLYPRTGTALVVGITGPPGAGKSSLIDRLIDEWRGRARRVAVIAVDPTSPISGGATLGDRIRIRERLNDSNVFVRSMATRGRRGGLAPSTASMIHLLDAAGFDRILVETVGVGQEEVDVTRFVHLTMLLQIPGSGDGVQALKAGLLEMADLYVVNKADLPGADVLARELSQIAALSMSMDAHERKGRRVYKVSAAEGSGIPELVDAIERIGPERKSETPRLAQAEMSAIISELIRQRIAEQSNGSISSKLVNDVAERRISPRKAAALALESFSAGEH
jgi:LAO/AO transport system kinase